MPIDPRFPAEMIAGNLLPLAFGDRLVFAMGGGRDDVTS